jgi:2-polyprenyl-3-methyl-5-hydroxy-6-metoxy-1,4-benzoquinol methylase
MHPAMTDRSQWQSVAEEMQGRLGDRRIEFGRYVSYWFDHTPRRALYHLSYYKFAAKLIGSRQRVLDVGCSEGLGTWLLAKECGYAKGLDLDEAAIEIAQGNWGAEDIVDFACEDVLTAEVGEWNATTSFDVVEHILPDHANAFFRVIAGGLDADGMCIVGTPSLEGQRYASAVSREGHVNLYDGPRLEEALSAHFEYTFLFGANDEVVHSGFPPMCHYLIGVGVKPRR